MMKKLKHVFIQDSDNDNCNGINEDCKNLHVITDRRDSNFDGSAYYFHERDAMPLYVFKVNRGLYCIYTWFWKKWNHNKLIDIINNDKYGTYVKINMNWQNIFKRPRILYSIFTLNFYLLIKNIYLWGKDVHNCCKHVTIFQTGDN